MLKAESAQGTVAGQVAVMGTGDIRTVSLVPGDAQPPPLALERIAEADQIVIGPGSLFTSVLAAVAVQGIAEAVASAEAQVVYVCNLRPEVPRRGLRRGGPCRAPWPGTMSTVDVVLCDSIGGHGHRQRRMYRCTTSPDGGEHAWCTARPNWRRRCPVCWHSRPGGKREGAT